MGRVGAKKIPVKGVFVSQIGIRFLLPLGVAMTLGGSRYAFATEQIKLYGQVNKELRAISQELHQGTVGFQGVADVEASESRMGIKGVYLVEGITFRATIEVGVNSPNQMGSQEIESDPASPPPPPGGAQLTGEQIGFRKAEIAMVGSFGTLILGQTDIANTFIDRHDPFGETGFAFSVSDQKSLVKALRPGGVGYKSRNRANLLGFKSPDFNGFYLYSTLDKNNTLDRSKAKFLMYWSTNVIYQIDKGLSRWLLTLNYNKQLGNSAIFSQDYWHTAVNFGYGAMMLYLIYGQEKRAENLSYRRYFTGITYQLAAINVAMGYGLVDLQDAGTDGQSAIMVNYQFREGITCRVMIGQYVVQHLKGHDEMDNVATIASLGMTVHF